MKWTFTRRRRFAKVDIGEHGGGEGEKIPEFCGHRVWMATNDDHQFVTLEYVSVTTVLAFASKLTSDLKNIS